MLRVDVARVTLLEAALVVDLGQHPVLVADFQELVRGQQRRLARTQLGEHDPRLFLAGVGAERAGQPAKLAVLVAEERQIFAEDTQASGHRLRAPPRTAQRAVSSGVGAVHQAFRGRSRRSACYFRGSA